MFYRTSYEAHLVNRGNGVHLFNCSNGVHLVNCSNRVHLVNRAQVTESTSVQLQGKLHSSELNGASHVCCPA